MRRLSLPPLTFRRGPGGPRSQPGPRDPGSGRAVVARRLLLPRPWPLLLGGLAALAIGSLLGALLLGQEDPRRSYWSVTVPLAAGSVLRASDLTPVLAQLPDPGVYVGSGEAVAGRVLVRPVATGELLTRVHLTTLDPDRRYVAVPVELAHAPDGLTRGDLVDVWMTPDPLRAPLIAPPLAADGVPVQPGSAADAADGVPVPSGSAAEAADGVPGAAPPAGTRRVVAGLLVTDIAERDSFSGDSRVRLVLDVPADEVAVLIAALRGGFLDVVVIPGGRPALPSVASPSPSAASPAPGTF